MENDLSHEGLCKTYIVLTVDAVAYVYYTCNIFTVKLYYFDKKTISTRLRVEYCLGH